MNIPSGLTAEEKQLKSVFENIRSARKLFEGALNGAGLSFGGGKAEQRADKMGIENAELNTEDVKKKVIQGMITVKKQDEKQTFKRTRVVRKGPNSAGEARINHNFVEQTSPKKPRPSETTEDGELVDDQM